MSVFESSPLQKVVAVPAVSRVRRNHGLEHATLNLLARKYPGRKIAGHSDTGGFWLLGEVAIEEVHQAVEEALSRLRAGERNLALHPNCGTNFVAAGVLAGLAAGASMLGVGPRTRDKVGRLPLTMSLATLAVIFGYPLGLKVQERVTTSGEPGELKVVEIVASRRGRVSAYRVSTRG